MNDIDKLKTILSNRGGAAVQNRFELVVTPPASIDVGDSRDLSILCDSCTLPGRQVTTVDYQILQQPYKIPNGFLNEDVTFSFILTNDFYAKRVFEAWANAAVDFDRYKVRYRDSYAGTIDIRQLQKSTNGENKVVYSTRLLNAFPTSIGSIPLDNSAENSIQKFVVSVAYENFINT